jgi:hypothetical protein
LEKRHGLVNPVLASAAKHHIGVEVQNPSSVGSKEPKEVGVKRTAAIIFGGDVPVTKISLADA